MVRASRNLTDSSFLEAALEGLLLQKQRIESQIAEVRSLLGRQKAKPSSVSAKNATKLSSGGSRQLSEAARKRIAAAQKKRWAEYRKQNRPQS